MAPPRIVAGADVERQREGVIADVRGLAARTPLFHNGAARDIGEVVDFYDQRFQMNLRKEEKSQLAAFLNSL